MTPRQDHARVLPPVDYRCTGGGGSSPAHSISAALGLDATRAHPIPAESNRCDGSIAPRRSLRSRAFSLQRVTTAALGLRAGGGGLFQFGLTARELGSDLRGQGSKGLPVGVVHDANMEANDARYRRKDFTTGGKNARRR